MTRTRGIILLLTIYALSVLLRFLLLAAVPAPFLTDELFFAKMARAIAHGEKLRFNYPTMMYPLLLSPMLGNMRMEAAYPWIRFLNVLLMNTVVLFTFGFAREFVERRRALIAAALTAFLPGIGYSAGIMAENLFLPLFTLALWMCYRAIAERTPVRGILCGIASGFAFHAKIQAIVLPAAVLVCVIVSEIIRSGVHRRETGSLRRFFSAIASWGWVVAGWLIVIAPRLWKLTDPRYLTPSDAILGSYATLADLRVNMNVAIVALLILGHLVVATIGTGVLPFVTLIDKLIAFTRGAARDRIGILALLIFTTAIGLYFIVIRFSLSIEVVFRIHERYVFVLAPAVLILFAAMEQEVRVGRKTSFITFCGAMAMGFVIARKASWSVVTDAPSLTAFLALLTPDISLAVKVGLIVLMVVAMLALVFLPRPKISIAIGLILLWLNVGWYSIHYFAFHRFREEDHRTLRQVLEATGSPQNLITIVDTLPQTVTMNLPFWRHSQDFFLRDSGGVRFATRSGVESDGTLALPFRDEGATVLTGRGFEFTVQPQAALADVEIYRLPSGGTLQLTARGSQPELFGVAGRGDAPSVTWIRVDAPSVWRSGETRMVEATVVATTPHKTIHPTTCLGYRWLTPGAQGSWRVLSAREDCLTQIPLTSHPVTFEIPITAPSVNGKNQVLVLDPFITTPNGRTRLSRDNEYSQWIDLQ